MGSKFPVLLILLFVSFSVQAQSNSNPPRIEILFLGHADKVHHPSEKLADIFLKEYFNEGINITYSTDPEVLNDETLAKYDGFILYANIDSISSSQEKALLGFVNNGKGFIPLHCASFCFRNSPEVVALTGGQFLSHKYDSFPAVILQPDHPVMKDITSFTTKDETYLHHQFSNDITVLTERVEGSHHEPYTWVKNYGTGRVFYTAYGHDENTYNNPGFLQLVKNGIFWAIGEKAAAKRDALHLPKLTYTDGMVPNYEKRKEVPKVQQPLTPAESMSMMQVPPGFDLKLFAAEPDIINPIFMNWDEKGRLWVIETIDYPNEIKDDEEGDDRIKILEDTDGDGKADKFTLFADKLNIPTSFVFTNGGILVSMAPSFLFLKDTDGDGKADVRNPVLKGWGKSDTHAQASNLRYGFDNKIWGVVGYSGFSGKVNNDSLKFGSGIYRMNTDATSLEYISTTSNNTWGLGFSEEFDVFISTANNTHSGFMGIPKRYLDKSSIKESGVEKIDAHYSMHVATNFLRQVDVHGGFTAAAGHSLYTARNFPKEYWNRIAFVNEPTGRLVHRTVLKQAGSGFQEDGDGWNMLASSDDWAGPIQTEVGPDGALWIADWYDFIIQHNPTPSITSSGIDAVNGKGNAYINPLRDHDRGRIYRIVYKADAQETRKSLDSTNNADLIKVLSDKNMFWRMTAQRLLVEKKDMSVIPDLVALVQNEQLDSIGTDAGAVHALWTLEGMGALSANNRVVTNAVLQSLSHPAGGVRKAAISVLPKNSLLLQAFQKNNLDKDEDFRVRLAVVLALIDMPPSIQVKAFINKMSVRKENLNDKWISQALLIASGKKVVTNPNEQKQNVEATDRPGKTILVKVVKDAMKFDKTVITAKAGSYVEIIVDNPDFMQHNFVLIKPGSTEKVGAAADELARAADGAERNYVPQMPEVLKATPLINPGKKFTLKFRIPNTPGDYPYLCTFPGHWRIMKGILRVSK